MGQVIAHECVPPVDGEPGQEWQCPFCPRRWQAGARWNGGPVAWTIKRKVSHVR